MAIEKKYFFKNYHISEFTLTNDSDKTVTVQSADGPEYTLTAQKNKKYSLRGLPDGSLFTVYVTVIDPKTSKDAIYILNFYHSVFSDAQAQVKASALKALNDSNVIFNKESDHRFNHVKRLELHAVTGVGYCAKFRIYFKKPGCNNWEYKTSGRFPLGKSKYWDCIEELHLPDNTMVRPAVCSILNLITNNVHKEKKHDDIWYVRQESKEIKKYKCTGTVGNPKIAKK